MGVVRGVERFQGRSSFKTWLFAILVHRARSAGFREHPDTPIEVVHTVDPLRFDPEGSWARPPRRRDRQQRQRVPRCRRLAASNQICPPRSTSSSTTGSSFGRRRRALPRPGEWRARDQCREPTNPVTPGPGPPMRDPRSRDGEELTNDVAATKGPRVSASSRAGHGLPRRGPVSSRPTPIRSASSGLPNLYDLLGADQDDHSVGGKDRARRPDCRGTTRPRRSVSTVAFRVAAPTTLAKPINS
jgi:hypothetical protein